jgi:hypothetical protein
MVKRGLNEDFSNKVVFVLAVLVVLVVATSTWLVLNKVSNLDVKAPQPKVISITKVVEQGAPTGGIVGLSILPSSKEKGK